MNELKLVIGAHTIILRAAEEIGLKFSGLAELMDLPLGMADSRVSADLIAELNSSLKGPLFTSGPLAVYFDHMENNFRISFFHPLRKLKLIHQVYVYQVMITFGLLSAMLRGAKIIPVHGALLENGSEALLLCGESGVGKSTSARRWREAGGQCYADDLILVDYSEAEFFTHPLPTWSLCKESLAGQLYPFNRRLPLKAVLGLSRGEDKEYIAPISGDDFFAQLYRSAFFHILAVARCLPDKAQHKLAAAVRCGVEKLAAKFPPCGLFAHLDGDLKSTLEEYL